MKTKIEVFLKFFIVVDLVILLINFMHNYIGVSWISASPGRRLNNPFAGLLIAIFLLAWANPDLKAKWSKQIKTFLTCIPQKYYFFGILFLSLFFLEGMHLVSPQKSYWDLNIEKGYGTYFSTFQLFLLGVSVLIIGLDKKNEAHPVPKVWEWNVFAGIILLISLDECLGIHDKIGVEIAGTISKWPILTSVFVWLWVYAPLIVGSVVFFIRFFLRIGKEFCKSKVYLYAGLTSWVVAIVLEVIARKSSLPRSLLIAAEEGLEILGATLFLLGVGAYIEKLQQIKKQFSRN